MVESKVAFSGHNIYLFIIVKCRNVKGIPIFFIKMCGIISRDGSYDLRMLQHLLKCFQFAGFIIKIVTFKNIAFNFCQILIIIVFNIMSANNFYTVFQTLFRDDMTSMQTFKQNRVIIFE